MRPLIDPPQPVDPSTQLVPPPVSDLDDPRVLQALEEYQAALEAGQRPNRFAFLARFPDIAHALGECLDGLDLVRSAASELHPSIRASEPMPERLGDFRLIRRLGRGGMGIVYEAHQDSLHRRVAVKVLPSAAALDDRQLRRFQNEAHAAAHLQHPHIVPVYATGEEAGVYYYAMQIVDGPTLADVIDHLRVLWGREADISQAPTATAPSNVPQAGGTERRFSTLAQPIPSVPEGLSPPRRLRPEETLATAGLNMTGVTYCRAAASLALQAAEGLAHAHEQDVVHRDIKPSNLLLDRNGQVWIADFGLARFASDVRLTRTGEIVGTLRYLSPEQVRGAPADHRVDIYALGATLYELVTLETAFPGDDRATLMRQIVTEEPIRPGRHQPDIPRDLETILLVAMAKEPSARYPSAAALADDLRRFLDGQPIHACRPSLTERTTRWCRRHALLLAVAAAGLLIACTGLVIGLGIASRSLEREVAMRLEKEATGLKFRQAVDEVHTVLADRWLAKEPHLEPVQRAVLEKVLSLYQDFLAESGNEPTVRYEAARAYRRVGDIRAKLGMVGAGDAYAEAIRLLNALIDQSPTLFARYELALCENNLANLALDEGKLTAAEGAYRRSRQLFATLATEFANEPDIWEGLGGTSVNLGIVQSQLHRSREAESSLAEGRTILHKLLTESQEKPPRFVHSLATAESNLANLLRSVDRLDEAEPLYRQALKRQSLLTIDHPSEPSYRQAQSVSQHGLGLVQAARRDWESAQTSFEIAERIRTRLAEDFPRVPTYRRSLGSTLQALGEVQIERGQRAAADATLRRALTIRMSLAAAATVDADLQKEVEDTRRWLDRAKGGDRTGPGE